MLLEGLTMGEVGQLDENDITWVELTGPTCHLTKKSKQSRVGNHLCGVQYLTRDYLKLFGVSFQL